ncbi:RNA polymerase factor sigma-70 [Ectopseudomonas composti]|jgi:RNA polymerase sigma-70 factor (ECF subfamily)|uniref:RNA polymerase sigma-70 factor, ECF subfamily n=1 Tax=Ectopseudomonas composti TaxID=658457 RepID=A0A1I5KBR7_9GAMM|nr:RNA polymerase factor sigma-70 [Pseudomonas composti]SFO82447.1 RNA polymerase sigma-70 factor, ECF subfamily [Pseudomonas composti]
MPKTLPTQQHLTLHDLFVTRRHTFINAAARILGCRSHAEDVVHDAYIKLSTASMAPSIQSQSSYLLRVVRNLAIDLYRRQALEKRYSGSEEEGLYIAAPGASPETSHESRETLEMLSSALAQMPERTRYAFEMYKLHGRTQNDIAKELGVSPTLVNFMVRDALLHCRQSLKRMESKAR